MAYGEGSCLPVKGKSGTYRLKAYDPHTRRQKMKTVYNMPSRRAAEAELVKFKKQLAAVGPTLDPKCTVEEFLDYWMSQKRSNWSPTTYKGYEAKLKKVRRDFPREKLTKLDGQPGAMFLDYWYVKWQREGASAAEVFHTHRVLSSALHQAERWGFIERSATDLASAPSYEPPPVEEVDPEVLVRFIEYCKTRRVSILPAAVIIAATTGLRRGELCAIRWPDFNPEKGRLMVDSAVKYTLDRLEEDEAPTKPNAKRRRKVVDGATKTRQKRPITLHPGAVLVLLQHFDEVTDAAAKAGATYDLNGYIFTLDPTGSTPWKPDSYRQALYRATFTPCPECGFKWKKNRDAECKICGGKGKVKAFDLSLMDLRHFHGTHGVASGIDVRTMAGRMGNDFKVLLKHYAAFLPSKDQLAAQAVGDLLLPVLPVGKGLQAAS